MTNAELIQAIRNEIERLKTVQLKRIQEGDLVDAEPYDKDEAYNELLDFLDTLESEKPLGEEYAIEIGKYTHTLRIGSQSDIDNLIRQEKQEQPEVELEERICSYDKNEAYNELLSFLETLESGKPMQEELEEEIAGMYQALFGTDVINRKEMIYLDTFEAIARHFVQWQKEQMMKEAVEGEVCIPNVWVEHKEGKELVVRAEISKELGFKFGDKVRVFIVKEG